MITFDTTISLTVGGIANELVARVAGRFTPAINRHYCGSFAVDSIALRDGETRIEFPKALTMLISPEQWEQLEDYAVEYCENEGA